MGRNLSPNLKVAAARRMRKQRWENVCVMNFDAGHLRAFPT